MNTMTPLAHTSGVFVSYKFLIYKNDSRLIETGMPSRAHNGRISEALCAIQAHGQDFTAHWLRSRCGMTLRQAHNAITQAISRGLAVRTERGHYRALGT